jgi:2-polyprenyl-6-methoxyphenol hydroxylase-like FAD-dependent oxidoreductase
VLPSQSQFTVILLTGDAVHLHSPAAGQIFNGVRDGVFLGDFYDASRIRIPPSSQLSAVLRGVEAIAFTNIAAISLGESRIRRYHRCFA